MDHYYYFYYFRGFLWVFFFSKKINSRLRMIIMEISIWFNYIFIHYVYKSFSLMKIFVFHEKTASSTTNNAYTDSDFSINSTKSPCALSPLHSFFLFYPFILSFSLSSSLVNHFTREWVEFRLEHEVMKLNLCLISKFINYMLQNFLLIFHVSTQATSVLLRTHIGLNKKKIMSI